MAREPPILEPPVVSVTQPRKGWWKFLPILALTAFVSVIIFIARYEPVANKQYYPKCGFKQITGFDCPGCGGLRATHALTRCRIAEAFRFHPALVLSLPIVAYIAGLWIREWRRTGTMPVPLAQPECNRPLKWIAVLFVSLGLLRNIPAPPFSWIAIPPPPTSTEDVEKPRK